jgi:drug/metabolite transporter (DMT)-like permease
MDGWLVAAALTSAFLHAGWNAAVKASARPTDAMTAQMLGSALLALPVLLWSGLPAAPAWPWMAASTLFVMGAVGALLRGYAHGGFGVIYPMTRASSVLLVLPLAAAVAGEWPSWLGLAGVALVSLAVLVLALGGGKARSMTPPALLWILAAAACTAGYVVCDAQGVRVAGSALAYGCALSVVNGVLWAALQGRAGARPADVAAQWPVALPAALAAMLSYVLILWVFTRAPIALAAALRDTSAVFATLIAVVVLKEPFQRQAVFAVALATAGSVLIRLG